MGHRAQRDQASPPLRWWKASVIALAAIVVAHTGMFGVGALPINTGLGYFTPLMSVDLTDHSARPGYVRVAGLTPTRLFFKAGLQKGDQVRFDRPRDVNRTAFRSEEPLGLSVIRDARTTHLTIHAPKAETAPWAPEAFATVMLAIFMILAGVLIAIRAQQGSGILLGASMVSMGMVGSFSYEWENLLVPWLPMTPFWSLIMILASVGVLAFALIQSAEATGRRVTNVWRVVFAAYLIAQAASWLAGLYSDYVFREIPVFGGVLYSAVVLWLGPLVACGLLIHAAYQTRGQNRTRLGFLAAALGLYFFGGTFLGVVINMTGNDFSFSNPVAVLRLAATAAGVGVFLYAMLRHRVVDLGFAVNRTLVYGVMSTALLLAFFFLEWGAEQIVPVEMREANLLVSAGIAFTLFLIFHKARDWVEKGVETLFFHAWRDNDAHLGRFLKDAAYINQSMPLRQAALKEFGRYTGGATVGVYEVERDGSARLKAGHSLPPSIEANHPVLVRLRADREPLENELPETLEADLVLPMILRTEVRGFVLIGAKPSGEDYRPDERDTLTVATQRIGMDLHALEIDRLEAEVQRLTDRKPSR